MVSPSQCEEGPSQPKESNKRKFTKESNTSFKVMSLNFKKRTHLLHKPDLQGVVVADSTTYPTVCLREDSADNEYAFHIMHDLNHQNILNMKLLCDNKLSKDPTSVATFVEPYDGLLWSTVDGHFADRYGLIPSPELQNYLSQIAEGIDFLRKNNLYHGDLSWDTTLYHGTTVKLAGFKSKESVMTKEEAQWYDWTCYFAMLKLVSERVSILPPSDCNIWGDLDSLIDLLQTLDRTSLSTIKDTVFEHIFFWKLPRRLKFFAHTISLKLKDARFRKQVSKSAIRGKSWNVNCSTEFKHLLESMNNYQEAQRQNSRKDKKGKATKNKNVKAYDGDSLNDYVRVICGACTHWRQLSVDVDSIIRVNHPTLYSDVKNILEISEREAAASDVYVVQKDPQEPCCTATI